VLPLDGKYAKKFGLCQCVTPGSIFSCTSTTRSRKTFQSSPKNNICLWERGIRNLMLGRILRK
jgi:hypothetical protein